MLAFINLITDKPDWHRKVFDDETLAKWNTEVMQLDWKKAGVTHGDFSRKMFDYVSLSLFLATTSD
jgi:hypothetical protein